MEDKKIIPPEKPESINKNISESQTPKSESEVLDIPAPLKASSAPVQPFPQYKPYVPRTATPEYKAFKEKVISRKGMIITILSFILGLLFTETIFFGSSGISIPFFAIAFYSTLFYFFKEGGKPINKAALYLTFPVALLSLSFFIHYNPSTQFITWLTLIATVCIQLILFGNIQVKGIFTIDMLAKIFVNLAGRPFTNLGIPFHSFALLKGNKSKTLKNVIYILIGLAVSLPIAAILMNLFMSADALFANAAEKLIDMMGLDFRIFFWKLIFGFIFGLFLSAILLALKYSQAKQKPAAGIGDNIEGLIIATFLTIINIFIVAFVVFQFVYLFGGDVNITVSGMTYAEYARRGFFELSAASGIIFSIALFVLIMTKKRNGILPVWVQAATVCLCLCDGVLLVSAVKRMLLYVDVYGLSVKRVLTLWFMALIGICLLWMIIKCFSLKMDVMKFIGITVITAVCLLSLVNTERIIASYNVDKYLSSPAENSIDIYYLGGLSYTAVPEIARLKGTIGSSDIKDLFESQQMRLKYRNKIYGFTLDSIAARSILAQEAN